jgi:phosphoglycerate kinase
MNSDIRTIRDIEVLDNIPVIVRAPMNEPVENGIVEDDYRLRRVVPTLRYLADHGARVVVISHVGQKGTETLEPIAGALSKLTEGVSFFPETIGERARAAVRSMSPGDILVMENLRRDAGETGNDLAFAKELAALGDIFVEDSFDTCHRAHASIVTLPKLLPSYAGLLLEQEVATLSAARTPTRPALAVIGGAKFHSKEAVLTTLLETYDHVFVGGALTNDFLKEAGHSVGKSLVSGADPTKVRALLNNPKLMLPTDVRVVSATHQDALDARTQARVATVSDVQPEEIILDQGPATNATLDALAPTMKTILWNGPLGNYEHGFIDGTDAFAHAAAASKAHTVIGGGDTVTAIEKLGLVQRFSFVSTGGGAMLGFLARGTLPGIEALTQPE